jgi:hypothetical protein
MKMEKVDFTVEIRGKIDAYNTEHAADVLSTVIESFETELCEYKIKESNHFIRVGSDIKPFYISRDWEYEIKKQLEKDFKNIIGLIIEDLDKNMPRQPHVFDRTDYKKLREVLDKKIEFYKNYRWVGTDGDAKLTEIAEISTKKITSHIKDEIQKRIVRLEIEPNEY